MKVQATSIISKLPSDTEELGSRFGKKLMGGEVIELVGDLGSGKTTFVRGLARGADSTDIVTSPSFTINKVYKWPKGTIQHFDFYRLSEPGIVGHELAEAMTDPTAVVVIEWPEAAESVLPQKHVIINFKPLNDEERSITFTFPAPLSYLMEEVLDDGA